MSAHTRVSINIYLMSENECLTQSKSCLLNSLKEMKWHSEEKIQKDFKPGDLEFRSWFFFFLLLNVAIYLAK